jgi:tRNA A-37 threonylcarbamoyl transferase component Bud32
VTYLYRFRRSGSSWGGAGVIVKNPTPANVLLTADPHGAILYPCPDGWCEISAAALRDSQPPAPIVHRSELRVLTEIRRDRFGCLWFVTLTDAFDQCPGDRQPVSLPTEITNVNILVQELADGRVLIASEGGGVAIGRPGHFQVVTPQNGLPDSQTALPARDGTIWVGGDQGLYRLNYPFQMEYWTSHDGLNGTFTITRLGSRVLAGSGKDIVALDADRSRWSALPHGRGIGTVMRLVPSPNKTMFALIHRNQNSVIEIAPDGQLLRQQESSQLARWILLTKNQQLWTINRQGASPVQRLQAIGKQLVATPEPLPGKDRDALDIEESSVDGSLWTCYAEGLAVHQQSGWVVTANRGSGLKENECFSMAIHPNGDIWYAYPNVTGLARIHFPKPGDFRDAEVHNDTSQISGPSSDVHFVGIDRRGWIWVGTTIGIFVASESQAEQGAWWRLTDSDGLPSVSTNQGSFLVDEDGSVWFAVDTNIVHFRPQAEFVESTSPPNVFISAFSAGGAAPRLAEIADSFKSGIDVTAHIGSLQFDRRNNLDVRYRILPEQASWSDAKDMEAKLGALHWGSHSLEVEARLGDGAWSPTVSRTFTVLKPWWVAWQFLLGLAVVSAAGAVAGVSRQRKNKLRRLKILPDLSFLRMRILSPEVRALDGELLDGRFEIGRVLARGGFATVVESRDMRQNGSRCAVKIFRQEWADEEWTTKRFRQEVQALEQITHPNVVRIYGHGTTPTGTPYLAMEFIEGRTLREIISRSLPPLTTASYLRQMGSALNEIHKRGICHRDLKPENLMVRANVPRDREIVLIDFSIAIVKDPDETLHGLSRAAGTLHYMAPEQSIGYADPSTDIYSLAKILIEMLTGKRLSELLPDASIDLPQRVKELLVSLSLGLSNSSIALIARSLEFHPLHRPSDVTEVAGTVAADLERQSNDDPGVAAD